jgi:orotidine-5'-phosphate decarboxylase
MNGNGIPSSTLTMRERPRLIVALDVDDVKTAHNLIKLLHSHNVMFKVGPGLLLRAGTAVFETLQEVQAPFFLDLKFHDIPSTVFRSIKAACLHRPAILDMHALNGRSSMLAAVEAARSFQPSPILLAISLLVSHGPEYCATHLRLGNSIEACVLNLAEKVIQAGLDGIVCSAREAPLVRQHFGPDITILCPGIRFPTDATDDYPSSRVCMIGNDDMMCANFFVMGRPIIASPDPLERVLSANSIIDNRV